MKENQVNSGEDKSKSKADREQKFKESKVRRFATRIALEYLLLPIKIAARESMYGLIEGSIVDADLTYPDKGKGYLTHKRAQGGRWVAHDFKRPSVFPSEAKRGILPDYKEGRLSSLILDEVIDKDEDDLTPLGLLNIAEPLHIIKFNSSSPGKLVDEGLMRLTSYEEAYDNVGLYDEFGEELHLRGVAKDSVFQVTPKGNTLIFVSRDSGSKKPQEEREKSFEWLPGILKPIPIS